MLRGLLGFQGLQDILLPGFELPHAVSELSMVELKRDLFRTHFSPYLELLLNFLLCSAVGKGGQKFFCSANQRIGWRHSSRLSPGSKTWRSVGPTL